MEERNAVRELVVAGHVRERGRGSIPNKSELGLYAAEALLVDP